MLLLLSFYHTKNVQLINPCLLPPTTSSSTKDRRHYFVHNMSWICVSVCVTYKTTHFLHYTQLSSPPNNHPHDPQHCTATVKPVLSYSGTSTFGCPAGNCISFCVISRGHVVCSPRVIVVFCFWVWLQRSKIEPAFSCFFLDKPNKQTKTLIFLFVITITTIHNAAEVQVLHIDLMEKW